jgi:hypothetical protein
MRRLKTNIRFPSTFRSGEYCTQTSIKAVNPCTGVITTTTTYQAVQYLIRWPNKHDLVMRRDRNKKAHLELHLFNPVYARTQTDRNNQVIYHHCVNFSCSIAYVLSILMLNTSPVSVLSILIFVMTIVYSLDTFNDPGSRIHNRSKPDVTNVLAFNSESTTTANKRCQNPLSSTSVKSLLVSRILFIPTFSPS